MSNITRRTFITRSLKTGAVAAATTFTHRLTANAAVDTQQDIALSSHEALYYKKLPNHGVQCFIDSRRCVVYEGERGYCGTRENRGGVYYTLVYERSSAVHPEPVERHHFYHLLPGQKVLAVGNAGCNLRCKFCETWPLSQSRPEEVSLQELSALDIVERAQEENCSAIIFAYNEPAVYFEYMLAVAKAAKQAGLITAAHTAGHICVEPLQEVCAYLDVVNIDLKGFTQQYYEEHCGGAKIRLENILTAIKTIRERNTMLEITNLVIPEYNDNLQLIADMSKWLKDNVGIETPLHFARFFPNYQMAEHYATPLKTLEAAWEVACNVGLQYVYLDSVGKHDAMLSYCPQCGKVLIERSESEINIVGMKDGKCINCAHQIPGVW